jgi:cell wall-associated NlpC family hydrolase
VLLAAIGAACALPGAASTSVARAAPGDLTGEVGRQVSAPVSGWLARPTWVRPAPVAPRAVPAAPKHAQPQPSLDAKALRRAKHYEGTRGPWSHLCLKFVRKVYGLPARDPSAIAAWHASDSKHKGDAEPPAGVPVFWSGGGPGHVALSLGDGWVLTSDYPTSGRVTKVEISTLDAAWGLHYLGWTDDLEGVVVHQ